MDAVLFIAVCFVSLGTSSSGDYSCDCAGTGFDGYACQNNVDECALGTHNCDPNFGECTDTDGGFTCACAAGSDGDGVTCTACPASSSSADDACACYEVQGAEPGFDFTGSTSV